MDKYFKTFIENITLTDEQQNDALVKYTNVCKVLYRYFYPNSSNYDDSKKFLFGSYKTKTNIRPITEKQDVDVLFKIPDEVYKTYKGYQSNGASTLLQEVRNVLKDTYTTTETIKAWGKVVLLKTADGKHNVELLPAYEESNGTFIIPNSKNGGSWDIFNPRQEINDFETSNNQTKGLTRDLTKIIKAWIRNTPSMTYKSYQCIKDVITFLNTQYSPYTSYDKNVFNFFDYMYTYCNDERYSYIKTAHERATKAIEYRDQDKYEEASEEWKEVFGRQFPKAENPPKHNTSTPISSNPTRPWCF